jgi:hypothetical protein
VGGGGKEGEGKRQIAKESPDHVVCQGPAREYHCRSRVTHDNLPALHKPFLQSSALRGVL